MFIMRRVGVTDVGLVQRADLVIEALGYWPTFHDAKVVRLDRTSNSCTADIHVFQMTDRLDATGHFLLDKHHVVRLCMRGVRTDTLPQTYPGDTLFALDFHKAGPCVRVEFVSVTDSGGEVLCDEVLIESVVPYRGVV